MKLNSVDEVDFSRLGDLIPVIVQDNNTNEVLMCAYADREAIEKTISTGLMHFRSRSRGLWQKGETSGNIQNVISLTLDCDNDTLLARVNPAGPACHNGTVSCFVDSGFANVMASLDDVISERAENLDTEDESYTKTLLRDKNLQIKKIGEESAEFISSCLTDDKDRISEEAADVVYHLLVAAHSSGASWLDIEEVLKDRMK